MTDLLIVFGVLLALVALIAAVWKYAVNHGYVLPLKTIAAPISNPERQLAHAKQKVAQYSGEVFETEAAIAGHRAALAAHTVNLDYWKSVVDSLESAK